MSDASHLTRTTLYLLSKLGRAATTQFTEELDAAGLRPKHYGLLSAIQAQPMASQQMLGRALGLVPSAIVSMIDDLEEMNAIRRIPADDDRRRYAIALTERGQALLKRVTAMERSIDTSFLAGLSEKERLQLHGLLAKLAAIHLAAPGG